VVVVDVVEWDVTIALVIGVECLVDDVVVVHPKEAVLSVNQFLEKVRKIILIAWKNAIVAQSFY
jgi:hypothetical protein